MVTKMRPYWAILTAAGLALALVSPVLAEGEEAAQYNFASAQGAKELQATPGGEVQGVIYFYNIDGNRITHISLDVAEAPDGWTVEIAPPRQDIQVDVNGVPTTVNENLHVSPSQVLAQEPAPVDVPEGMVSISVPTRGYALAVPAYITIRAPASAALGATGQIVIAGEAAWLGQTGSAAIKQARDFDFSVTVVSQTSGFTETIPGESGNPPGGGTAQGPVAGKWVPIIIGAAVVAVVGGVVASRRRTARRKAS